MLPTLHGVTGISGKQKSLHHDGPCRPKAFLQANLQIGAEASVFEERGKGQVAEKSGEELCCPQKGENPVVADECWSLVNSVNLARWRSSGTITPQAELVLR